MKRNLQAGFALLLEMMVVCAVLLILAAVAVPNLVAIRASENTTAAYDRIAQVAHAQAALAMCGITPQCVPTVGVTALVPAPGEVPQRGYNFTFTQNADGTWTYVAVPVSPGFSGNRSFYSDQTGILRCGTDGSAPAC